MRRRYSPRMQDRMYKASRCLRLTPRAKSAPRRAKGQLSVPRTVGAWLVLLWAAASMVTIATGAVLWLLERL